MTIDDVQAAAEHLCQHGVAPSANKILARLGTGSKKTVLKYLHELEAAGVSLKPVRPEPPPAPAPVPVPVEGDAPVGHAPPPDPVAQAEAAVLACEADQEIAREEMDQAALAVLLSRGVIDEGVRYGGYADDDPAKPLVRPVARTAMGHYRERVRATQQARAHLTQVQRQYQRGHQEQWVAVHQPALPLAVAHWQDKVRTATSDWSHAEAKKELAAAQHAYQTAVVTAPWSTNGTH